MTKTTSKYSDGLHNPESGATDSPWQPSWLHWLISALSGTVETEKQTAWIKKSNEEARIRHEEWLKNEQKLREERKRKNEEARMRHEEWLRNEQKLDEEARMRHEEWLRNEQRLDEEQQTRHEEWLKNEQQQIEELKKYNSELRTSNKQLRKENERLAELESKLDAVLHRSDSSSTPTQSTDKD